MQADSPGPHKCHAKPHKHAKQHAVIGKKHKRPKKGNRGRKLGPQAKGHAVPAAKRAPIGTKPHRGKHKAVKHPCA